MGDADCPSCSADCLPRGDFEGVANESATFSETGFSSNPVCVTVTDANGNSEFKCLDIKVKDFVYPLEMNIKGTLNSNGDCYLSNSNIIFTPDIDPLSSFEYPTNYYWEFEKDYQLMPLEEVEAYIAKYHHLPGTPSADKVEENGSFELGETTINHQVKIEEVFLHLIELEEETKALESVLFLHETLNRRWIK